MKIDISHITIPDNFHAISDFYIPEEVPRSGILYPNAELIEDNSDYNDIVYFLLEEAKKQKKLEFSLELEHEGIRILFRGHHIISTEGKVFIFRRLPSIIPDISDLGMPSSIIELLSHEKLNNGGLIIIAGETGQGKSTTAGAAIAYRLNKYASFCLTIENPVELPLQGFYETEKGRGVCFQTQVEDDDIEAAIKSSLRCYPSISNSILFLGEIRDGMMASEVLRIASNGHLVITTMHGGNLIGSLKRFLSLATSYKNANEADTKSMFASVFRLAIHQELEVKANGKKQIRPNVLFSSGDASAIANRLKTGNLELLSTDIQNQNNALQRGQSILKDIHKY